MRLPGDLGHTRDTGRLLQWKPTAREVLSGPAHRSNFHQVKGRSHKPALSPVDDLS